MPITERRCAARVRTYAPVRLTAPQLPEVIQTLTKDVSPDGLRCIAPDACPVATLLRIELSLSPGQEPMLLTGRTAWFRSLPYSDQFDLGVEFTDLAPETHRRLSSYLTDLAA